MVICDSFFRSIHFAVVPAADTLTLSNSDTLPFNVPAQHPAETSSIAYCSLLGDFLRSRPTNSQASQKSKLMNFLKSPHQKHLSRSKVSNVLCTGQLLHNSPVSPDHSPQFRRQKRLPRVLKRSLQRSAREGFLQHPKPPRSFPQSRNPGILRNTTYLTCGVSNFGLRFAVGRFRSWPLWWHGR